MDPQAVIRRRVARVLLFDDQDRLLLFHVRDPADPTGDPWWYLPGGGMDPGESPEQAARRELFEETGIEDAVDRSGRARRGGACASGSVAATTSRTSGTSSVAASMSGVIVGGGDDLEADAVAAHRWWTLADLETSSEVVYPLGLAETVGRLLREGPPAVPWKVDPLIRRHHAGRDVVPTTDAP